MEPWASPSAARGPGAIPAPNATQVVAPPEATSPASSYIGHEPIAEESPAPSLGTLGVVNMNPPPVPEFGDGSPESSISGLEVIQSERPAKPIVGGTLLVTRDQQLAVVADVDRDQVYVVDLAAGALASTIRLRADDEPARLVADSAGNVYVALRRGGAVASIDPHAGILLERHDVCPAPRGLALDPLNGELVVACYSGQLMRLNESGEVTWQVQLPNDLRDVVASGEHYYVSRLKTAELLEVERTTGSHVTLRPETIYPDAGSPVNDDGSFPTAPGVHEPRVLRRLLSGSDSQLLLFHQKANRARLENAYYATAGSVGGVTGGVLTQFNLTTRSFEAPSFLTIGQFLDVALSPDGTRVAVFDLGLHDTRIVEWDGGPSAQVDYSDLSIESLPGQASALSYTADGQLLVQFREPAALRIGEVNVALSDDSRWDTGHVIFHASTLRGVACVSCHPEAGEDGVSWDFATVGLRQTQALAGGIMDTAPLHWGGELDTVRSLMLDTYTSRMGGQTPSASQAMAVGMWLDSVRLPPQPSADPHLVSAGRGVFERFGCQACHSGEKLTDNLNHDVGTRGSLQTPTLIGLRHSAPYMHDGCAPTLRERFDEACGGSAHGDLALAASEDIDLLVAYLESL